LGLIQELALERIAVDFFADQMLDVVSTELVNTMVDDMYQAVDIAIKNTGKPLDSQMLEVMKDVRGQINESRRINGETLAGITSLVHFQKMMKESLRSASNAQPVN
jgi:conjugative transfer pilus assembly protein TraH